MHMQKEHYELFTVKQHDYGPHNISMGTDLKTKEDVNFALMALVIRINLRFIIFILKNETYTILIEQNI